MADCASCTYQRNKCPEDRVMARHFPRSRKRDFQLVHRVFGVSNVTRMLKDLDFPAAKRCRQVDGMGRVLGPLGLYERLEEDIPMSRTTMQPLVRLESSPRWPNPQSQERSSFVQGLEREQWKSWISRSRESNGRVGFQGFHQNFLQEQDRGNGVIQEMGFGGVDYPSLVQDLERESDWGGGIQAPQHYFVQGLERDSNGRDGVSDSYQNNISVLEETNTDLHSHQILSIEKQNRDFYFLSPLFRVKMANCASCAHQRRICPEGCVMGPHFPRTRTQEFQLVNRVFGVSNAIKILKDLDFSQQKETLIWEAEAWEQDPICGPLGLYERLEEQILMLKEEIQMLGEQNPVIQERGLDLERDNGHIHVQQQNVANPSFVQDLERERNHGVRGFHHQEQERGNNSGRQTILQQEEIDRESSGGGGIRTFQHHSVQELERESDERERASDSYQGPERGTHQNNNIPGN
ncbi:hypothetical protein Acr_00g0101340 [Actinidia rufa]|uniref:LOB domain-containing protein n=1 Tax=Actinidia rufa TaxID=165716 RepID=A0A7J0E1T4_9ERIC|nr:hypothetical protein Acr_00g0101340 [Actinidia rufa]